MTEARPAGRPDIATLIELFAAQLSEHGLPAGWSGRDCFTRNRGGRILRGRRDERDANPAARGQGDRAGQAHRWPVRRGPARAVRGRRGEDRAARHRRPAALLAQAAQRDLVLVVLAEPQQEVGDVESQVDEGAADRPSGADIVVENFRPGWLESVALRRGDLCKVHPALPFIPIPGYD